MKQKKTKKNKQKYNGEIDSVYEIEHGFYSSAHYYESTWKEVAKGL